MMYRIFAPLLLLSLAACGQSPLNQPAVSNAGTAGRVGGRCEGCEAIYESPIPFAALNEVDTLPLFAEAGPKLVVSGTVFRQDGKTPAPGVVLYVYQTDQTGRYRVAGGEEGWARRHGRIRGWVKTNDRGQYRFYTVRPAAYSKEGPPAHIHALVKEADKNEYFIADFLFADDPHLLPRDRERQDGPGGSGVLHLQQKEGVFYGERNIILGRNVENYPRAAAGVPASGLAVGESCPAFDPRHHSGPDAGTRACPMCKYGYGQGLMVWFKDSDLTRIMPFAKYLEGEMRQRGERRLRVFLVCMRNQKTGEAFDAALTALAREAALKKVALVSVPSVSDEETSGVYKINATAENTVLVYKKRTVVASWVNAAYDTATANRILAAL